MEKVVINVLDTQNTFLTVDRFTQLGAPILSYSGSESRFDTIVSSKLTFNMLNETGEDGKYLDLLSGQERRFLVEVRQATANNTIDNTANGIVWRGYLLPDVYNEPYDNVSFFVNFTATDGLDILRSKPFLFWRTRSVVDYIARCLFETGLSQEIYLAPGIENTFHDYKNIQIFDEVFTKYNDSSETYEYTTCYDVLDKLLKAIGSTLFQHNGKWFICGFNRRGNVLDTYKVYNEFGVFLRTENYMRQVTKPMFNNDTVNIGVESPYKTVQLNVDFDRYDTEVIPETFYKTDKYSFDDLIWPALKNIEPFNNWTNKSGADINYDSEDSTKYLYLDNEDLTNSNWMHPANELPKEYTKAPFYLNVYKHFSRPVNFDKDYVEIKTNKQLFVSSQVDGKSLEMDIDFMFKINGNVNKDKFNDDFYRQAIRVDVLINDQVVFSTRAESGALYESANTKLSFKDSVNGPQYNWYSYPNYGTPNYRLKRYYTPASLLAEVSKKGISVNTYGKLNVRIYLPRNKDNLFNATDGFHASMLTITKLNVSIKSWDNLKHQQVRAISYTTKFEDELPFADGKNDLYKNLFKINDRYDYKTTMNTIVLYSQPISTIEDALYYYIPINQTITGLVEDRFYSLRFWNNNNSVLAYQLFGNLTPESGLDLYQQYLRVNKARINEFPQFRGLMHGVNKVTLGEFEVYLLTTGSVPRDQYLSWTYGFGSGRYVSQYAKMIHECQPIVTPKIEAAALGIISPMDIIQFTWVQQRNFIPLSVSIDFSHGKTNLTMIESVNQTITDYA